MDLGLKHQYSLLDSSRDNEDNHPAMVSANAAHVCAHAGNLSPTFCSHFHSSCVFNVDGALW